MNRPNLYRPRFILALLFCFLFASSVFAEEKHIAAGVRHSLYVDPAGQVWAWGDTDLREQTNKWIPYLVMQNGRSVYASPNDQTSFVIKKDGSLWGWGASWWGQTGVLLDIGSDNGGFVTTPRQIMDQAKTISGSSTLFVIKPDNSLWTWGLRGIERGDTIREEWTSPHKLMDNIHVVSSRMAHTLVIDKDGILRAWGDNQCGALGTGDTKNSYKPVKVNVAPLGKRKVVQMAVRFGETYLLADDGTVWYSGEYNIRQDDCLDPPHLVPTKLDFIDNVKAIALGPYHELYLKKDGSVWASGYAEGAGSNLLTVAKGPGKVMDNVTEIAAGFFHSIALKKDGTVWTWGVNDDGQLGNGTNITTSTPVQVNFPEKGAEPVMPVSPIPTKTGTHGKSRPRNVDPSVFLSPTGPETDEID